VRRRSISVINRCYYVRPRSDHHPRYPLDTTTFVVQERVLYHDISFYQFVRCHRPVELAPWLCVGRRSRDREIYFAVLSPRDRRTMVSRPVANTHEDDRQRRRVYTDISTNRLWRHETVSLGHPLALFAQREHFRIPPQWQVHTDSTADARTNDDFVMASTAASTASLSRDQSIRRCGGLAWTGSVHAFTWCCCTFVVGWLVGCVRLFGYVMK
jgi:hypothetical protein